MTTEPQPLSMGRVFAARDPVSQFVTALAMAINDLAVIDRHLHEAMDKGSAEMTFYFRVICGYFHELGLLFRQARRVTPVEGFVATLDDDAREDFTFICRFEGDLAPIRKAAFHFPRSAMSSSPRRSRASRTNQRGSSMRNAAGVWSLPITSRRT